MQAQPIYQQIASKLIAMENCRKSDNGEWLIKHGDSLKELLDSAPLGGGIDSGITLLLDECSREKLVFSCDFHHMDDHGYDGWTNHKAIVTPSLCFDISIRITGRNRNEIKDYLHEVLHSWLTESVERN